MNQTKTGIFIREQRKKLGLSQQALAQQLYVEPQTISKWERGRGMPDYDNLKKLSEIFACSLSDILEPTEEALAPAQEAPAPSDEADPSLPAVLSILNEDAQQEHAEEKEAEKSSFSFKTLFSFLNKSKMKEKISRLFGYEYERVYSERFLFKGVLRHRKRTDYEISLTQGMFTDRIHHPVLGIVAPWLYLRLFFMLLLCSGIGILCSFIAQDAFCSILFCGALTVLPLVIFLFESNFSRNISILQVLKIFMIGGLCSLLLTFVFTPFSESLLISIVLLAPIFEELFKAILTVFFLTKIRPSNLLSGLLVGFAVGAGFDIFENYLYGMNTYTLISALDYDFLGATASATGEVLTRAFYDLFSGHHYWSGIFGALYTFYVLCKRKQSYSLKDILHWRVLRFLLYPILLHVIWNTSTVLFVPFVPFLLRLISSVLSIGTVILLINVGIAQTKIIEIYESAHEDAPSVAQTE